MSKDMKKHSLIILFLFLAGGVLQAQNDEESGDLSNQQVTVITDYTPVISDAFRMETLPEITDTSTVKPEFDYDIFSQKLNTSYNPDPLSAAQLKDEPKESLENGFARLALGSKLMLNAELYYNNTRDNDLNWGVRGLHHSGHGKLDNIVRDNVFAGYNKNLAGVHAKKMFTETTLKGSLNFTSNQHFFYGYNSVGVELPADYIRPVNKSDFIDNEHMQRYNVMSVRTEAKSRYHKHEPLNYRVSLDYDFWFDAKQNQEHLMDFDLNLNKTIKKEIIGADAGLVLIPASFDENTPMYINFSPYLAHNADNFKLKLGLHSKARFEGDSTSYHFYPDVYIEHNIGDVILPYASFSGNLQEQSMNSLSRTNPYIRDTLGVREVNEKQHIVLGFKGRISEEVQFNINGHYVKKDNQHFFVNDYGSLLRNRFEVAYSDVEMFRAYGELNFNFGDEFGLRLYGKYRQYIWLKDIEKAWHVPRVESGLYARFKVLPQLEIHADAFVLADRYAPVLDDTQRVVSEKLDPVIDVNLGARYSISRQFSAFAQLNNLAGQNYEMWNQYPVYGFHVMLGMNYSF
ncbi:MAG: hypothetical protein ACQES0_00760 [Bacteroidota bacterium]